MSHTPGPWYVNGDYVWKDIPGLPSRRSPSSRYEVALVSDWGEEETEANANLIAAAPELLIALQAMIQGNDNDPAMDPILAQALAAIEKATQ